MPILRRIQSFISIYSRCGIHDKYTLRSSIDSIQKCSEKKDRLKSKQGTISTIHEAGYIDTSFNNPEEAFRSKTTWEIIRGYIVYTMFSSNYLVENNMEIMNFMKRIMGKRIFGVMMKGTVYGHFVAGENLNTIDPYLKRIFSFGVKPILDYSVEENITQEEAKKREVESSMSEVVKPEEAEEALSVGGEMPQYRVDQEFADRRFKVNSARTYFYLNEATCERNLEIFQECVSAVAKSTYGTGFAAVKLTALGRPQLLLQLSEVIMRARKFVSSIVGGRGNVIAQKLTRRELEEKLVEAGITDITTFLKHVVTDKDRVIHLFPWSGILDKECQLNETFRIPSLKEKRMVRLISQLSSKEEEMFRNMIRRLKALIETAKDKDVSLMIDAEQSYFQPAISRIAMEFMVNYNKEKAIVFNTYQCYLKEAFEEVSSDLEQATRQNFYFGAKIVRGAYIDQERARSAAIGYQDPTNPSYDSTTETFHNTLTECMRRIQQCSDNQDTDRISIMVASHNEDTVRFAIQKMKEFCLPLHSVSFGQLLGMCDYITFPLGQAGYSVYKYIPYGPVHEVLPYLSRRAAENKGILKKVKKEKRLLYEELKRRAKKGQLWYTPKPQSRSL